MVALGIDFFSANLSKLFFSIFAINGKNRRAARITDAVIRGYNSRVNTIYQTAVYLF